MERMSRRRFLGLTAISLSGAYLVGCEGKDTNGQKELAGVKQRFIKTLEELPESEIKRSLFTYVLPFHKKPLPSSVQLGGESISVLGSGFNLKKSTNPADWRPFGEFTIRQANEEGKSYPLKDESLTLPYVGLLKDEEYKRLRPQDFATDNQTPIVKIGFPTDAPVYPGINPYVSFTLPNTASLTKEQKRQYELEEKFVFVKEASTHLVTFLWLNKICSDMQRLVLPTRFPVKDMQGKVVNTEFVIPGFKVLYNRGARLQAAIDISSYLVAFKALEGTDVAAYLTQESNKKLIFQEAAQQNIGTAMDSVLFNSLKWAVNSTLAHDLFHLGDIEKAVDLVDDKSLMRV